MRNDMYCFLILLVCLAENSLIRVDAHALVTPFTVIGDRNVTRRNHLLPQTFSKLVINGPFSCNVSWTDRTQTVDVYTDDNSHPHVTVNSHGDTLRLLIRYEANFKYTKMRIHLRLHPTISDIFLAGISTLHAENMLSIDTALTLHTEDTCSLLLALEAPSMNALFLSAGATKLIGRVRGAANIRYYGIGGVDASQLLCRSVSLAANGLGTIWITGIDHCSIKAEGVSIVRYNCSKRSQLQSTDLARLISAPSFV